MENAPNIRFKGFTDDWEQRKLSSLCVKFMDGDWIEAKDQSAEGIRLIQTGNVGVAEYLEKPDHKKWVSKETFDRLHCEEVFPDDILISRLPEPAGRACVVPDLGTKMITAVDCTILRVNENCAPQFLIQYLSSQDYFEAVNTCLAGGTRQRISRSNLAGFDIPIPPQIEEQQAIGSFFCHLDHLITLHQRKCDEARELKKYMLQKMFPQNGKNIPEIRFAGFTDDWEQRKLGDVFEQTVEYINPKEENLELWSVTVESGLTPKTDRYNREALVKKEDKFKAVHPNDIVYNPMNMTIGSVGFNKTDKCVAVSGYYVTMRMKEGFSSSYFNTWLTTPRTLILYKLYATGSLIEKQRIQFPTLSAITTPMPNFEEQEKIGGFFVELDRTIILHQRKCDELKEVKKFMLKNMFPQKG